MRRQTSESNYRLISSKIINFVIFSTKQLYFTHFLCWSVNLKIHKKIILNKFNLDEFSLSDCVLVKFIQSDTACIIFQKKTKKKFTEYVTYIRL